MPTNRLNTLEADPIHCLARLEAVGFSAVLRTAVNPIASHQRFTMLEPKWDRNTEKNRLTMLIRFGTRSDEFPDGQLEALVEPHGDDIHWDVHIRCLCHDQDMMDSRYDVLEQDIISTILNYADY